MAVPEKTTSERAEIPFLDVEAVRRDFPALAVEVNGRPLAYLDSAASAQKPEAVLAAQGAPTIHRGLVRAGHLRAPPRRRAYLPA